MADECMETHCASEKETGNGKANIYWLTASYIIKN